MKQPIVERKNVSLNELTPSPYNPRKISSEALEGLEASINRFGLVQEIVVNRRSMKIIGGHQRVEVLRRQGIDIIPVVFVDLDEQDEKALNLALNNPHICGEFDLDRLEPLLREIEEIDESLYDDLRLDMLSLEMLGEPDVPEFEGLTEPDDVPEPPVTPVTQPGDLWILGDHRLLCGDSGKAEDVIRLMDGNRAVLFATDPPYLVDYDGGNHPNSKAGWQKDGAAAQDRGEVYGLTWDASAQGVELYENFIREAIAHAITDHAAWYCWHASRRQAMLESVWEKFGAFVHQQIVWAKDRGVLGRSWYLWQHELCFFGWIKGNKPVRRSGDYPSTVWEMPTVKAFEATEHPTSKPVELFAIPMRQHTKGQDICYEPFSGSGSQIIAAEQLGRRCYAMEIEPVYVDVAVTRWEQFTGRKAHRPVMRILCT